MQFQYDYTERDGQSYETITVAFSEIRELLGREHDGSPEDDQAVVDALLAAGAPEWARGASGWIKPASADEPARWGLRSQFTARTLLCASAQRGQRSRPDRRG